MDAPNEDFNEKKSDSGSGEGSDVTTKAKREEPSFRNDFILVSEFSELEGPVPLFVLPEGANGKFNINDFVLRIMAVDYHNKNTDITQLSADSQLFIAQPNENAVAYIHHFTLLDISARGYVRPISMSYITHDSKKIMNHFNDFLTAFTKVANIMKAGNREIFKRDLEIRLADVKLTHDTLIQHAQEEIQLETDGDEFMVMPTPNTVSEYMKDLKELHKKLNKSIANDNSNDNNSQRDNSEANEQQQEQSAAAENSSSADDTDTSFQSSLGEYQPKVLHSLHKAAYYNKLKLRSLTELCGEKFEEAHNKLKMIQQHFSRPGIVLLLEKDDEAVLSPTSSLLTIGNTVALNFNLEADRQIRHMDTESKIRKLPKTSNVLAPIPAPRQASLLEEKFPHAHEVVGKLHSLLTENLAESEQSISNTNSPKSTTSAANSSNEKRWNADSLSTLQITNIWHNTTTYLESFSAILWSGSKSNCGCGLLDLKHRYSFLKHLIFSLLKGRPVIIYAQPQNEGAVKKMITALSLFVAGHWRKGAAVVPWQQKAIRIADLASCKLIGLSKQKPIPKSIERYVTILDYEQETLVAPPYSANFINEILSNRKQWPDEETFLAHIHYLLFDISTKACLYYHFCCIGPQSLFTEAESALLAEDKELNAHSSLKFATLNSHSKTRLISDRRSFSDSHIGLKAPPPSVSEHSAASFCKKLGLEKHDIEIIEYLAEVVKEQQALQVYGVEHLCPVIRLDYSAAQVFKRQL